MLLLSVVKMISYEIEKTFFEILFWEDLNSFLVEKLECCHASKVKTMGQIYFLFFNFSLKIDLLYE